MTPPVSAFALVSSGRWCDLSPTAQSVFVVLDFRRGKNKAAWPSIPTIGKDTGIRDRRTVERAIAELEKKNLLRVKREKGKPNQYQILELPAENVGTKIVGSAKKAPTSNAETTHKICIKAPTKNAPLINKGNKKEASTCFSSFLSRYSPAEQELIQRTIKAIRSTRKGGKIADSILTALLRWCDGHPVEQVIAGMEIYLDKGYAGEGKREAYLKGIIRNQPETKPKPAGTGSALYDAALAAGEEA